MLANGVGDFSELAEATHQAMLLKPLTEKLRLVVSTLQMQGEEILSSKNELSRMYQHLAPIDGSIEELREDLSCLRGCPDNIQSVSNRLHAVEVELRDSREERVRTNKSLVRLDFHDKMISDLREQVATLQRTVDGLNGTFTASLVRLEETHREGLAKAQSGSSAVASSLSHLNATVNDLKQKHENLLGAVNTATALARDVDGKAARAADVERVNSRNSAAIDQLFALHNDKSALVKIASEETTKQLNDKGIIGLFSATSQHKQRIDELERVLTASSSNAALARDEARGAVSEARSIRDSIASAERERTNTVQAATAAMGARVGTLQKAIAALADGIKADHTSLSSRLEALSDTMRAIAGTGDVASLAPLSILTRKVAALEGGQSTLSKQDMKDLAERISTLQQRVTQHESTDDDLSRRMQTVSSGLQDISSMVNRLGSEMKTSPKPRTLSPSSAQKSPAPAGVAKTTVGFGRSTTSVAAPKIPAWAQSPTGEISAGRVRPAAQRSASAGRRRAKRNLDPLGSPDYGISGNGYVSADQAVSNLERVFR